MRAFVTGATGYIGGSVAFRLLQIGYQVRGLTRNSNNAAGLRGIGIEPVIGELTDRKLLTGEASQADLIVNAADSDDRSAVEALLAGAQGSNKTLIHTSGSSIVSDQANGALSERIFDEDTVYEPEPDKRARVAIDRLVLDAAKDKVRSFVICPCMIYGEGLGLNKDSIQIPMLIAQARRSGIARYIGEGLNIWSTVHIADLADLYLMVAQQQTVAGTFLFAENGEISLRQIVEQIRTSLSLKTEVEGWPIEEAIKEWGRGAAIYALGANSRIRAKRARTLGWSPTRNEVLKYVDDACRRVVVAKAH